MQKLQRNFYNRQPVTVAQELLGKLLVHISLGLTRVGRIVEVEAYLGPHDLAAHSARGRTTRTEVMFGPPGHAYVYLIYGIHCCMNVVTQEQGMASAVLLRALEPIANIEGRSQGPLSDTFYIAAAPSITSTHIVKKPRIGVEYAGHWAKRLLRFYIKGNRFISKG